MHADRPRVWPLRSTSNGHAHVLGAGGGVAVAAASHGGFLAVVTAERKRKHFLSCFSVQVGSLCCRACAHFGPFFLSLTVHTRQWLFETDVLLRTGPHAHMVSTEHGT